MQPSLRNFPCLYGNLTEMPTLDVFSYHLWTRSNRHSDGIHPDHLPCGHLASGPGKCNLCHDSDGWSFELRRKISEMIDQGAPLKQITGELKCSEAIVHRVRKIKGTATSSGNKGSIMPIDFKRSGKIIDKKDLRVSRIQSF